MGKNKLQRFAEIGEFENVLELTDFQENDREKPRGRWKQSVFGNSNPLVLELACGKGEYTVELAHRNPGINYIGVDIKGARIWKGAKRAQEKELENVRFLRIYIDHLDEYFGKEEVDEIWITFPDPYPRKSNRSKRLSSPKFLGIFQNVLKKGGIIHFKTDSDRLFDYTLQSLEQNGCTLLDKVDNVHADRPGDPLLSIKTYYEKMHLEEGRIIKYVKFRLPEKPIIDE